MDKDSMSALAGLLTMDHPSDLVVNILLLGVLPGIGEELLFRGVIQKEIIEKWQNPHTAIWITAIIFSLFHFQVTGFIPKMMIGAILGYAYYYSGSLILPMIIHALNNSFATVSLYLSGGKLDINTIETENIPLTGVVISTILFSYIWYTIRRTTSPIA
ncbi:MAG: CPBP family intramembrane metalloprotease [Saprospiraceae bacterium]|nr:CPBP family intramembrane metalloprotease [Saprospiraceae bacterium]